jgi:ketosteroid isomerase-like protein
MPPRSLSTIAVLIAVLVAHGANGARAQDHESPVPHGLFEEIAAADSAMFAAFNTRDLGALRTMFTADLEFYHDQSGLTTYDENMEAFERLFAREDGLRRDLVEGSLEVYSMGDDGAIEVGEHTFCHTESGAADCGTFPFVMVWRQEGAAWKVARVISYGH